MGSDRPRLGTAFPRYCNRSINAGIPSLGSVPDAFRLERNVLFRGPIDLLFGDTAVNDGLNGTDAVDQLRAMEGIVRRVRRAKPDAKIVFLYFADTDKVRLIRRGQRPAEIQLQEKIADPYRLPSLDLATRVMGRIAAGQHSWKKDFKGLHPAPFGHAVYAAAIARLLDAAWSKGAIESNEAEPTELPAPLDLDNYAQGHLVDIHQATVGESWHVDEAWKPTDRAAKREGFLGLPVLIVNTPRDALHFKFRSTGVGILIVSGPDAGQIEWEIDASVTGRGDPFTRWSSAMHLPWAQMLSGSLSDREYELTLNIVPSTEERITVHVVRIINFMVNAGRQTSPPSRIHGSHWMV